MAGKKFWSAAIVVAVAYFLLGWLFYGTLMKDWFEAQSTSPVGEPNIGIIALACLVLGLLMSYTYPKGYKGGAASKEGMRFGILFALLVNAPSGLFMVAMAQGTWPALIVCWIWEIIVGAVLGVVTAKIYGSAMKA